MNTIVRMFDCSIASVQKKKKFFLDCLIENTNLYKKFCKNKLRIKMVNEELLADTVRKYTVLYDKSSADFEGMMLRELWGYQMVIKLLEIIKI